MKFLTFIFCFFITLTGYAQSVRPSLLHEQWKASWISVPGESPSAYGVYLYRKKISFLSPPDSLIIHISADNRYKLFVNEKQVSLGPARGDLQHWNFETLDIAGFLHAGENIVAAQVWNEGKWRAEGQISLRSGLIIEGDGIAGKNINTDSSWICIRDSSYFPLIFKIPAYYVAGPGEWVNMNSTMAGWLETKYKDADWKHAEEIMPGLPKGLLGGYGTIPGWLLVPADIPPMELKNLRLSRVIHSGVVKIPEGFPVAKKPFIVPAHSNVSILLDQGFLTNAYPEIEFSAGADAALSLGYAEALFTKYPSKGNRNETDGKIFIGREDSILCNGKRNQHFSTLSFRTYRYIRLNVSTKEDPLTIEDICGTATGYPFQLNARLESDNPEMTKMLEIGWRTARLCAMETYMDCPYYEQLQYIGDARIQALISLYNSGDERLLRNAMNAMDNSRIPEGITLSRHPSYTPQFIPTFSLWYIGMLHDYMMYGRDSVYLKNKLAGEREILHYFRNYQQPDGSVKSVPYWMFTDWVESRGWESGVGPVGKDGSSSLVDLQLLWAYQLAADMEYRFGMHAYAKIYLDYAGQLKKTIHKKYWDAGRKLFSDRPEKDLFSQHANALAILTGMFDDQEAAKTGELLLSDSSLAQASIYFKFYLHQALVKAGMGSRYLDWLGQWRENMKMGLSTWAEIPDINNARSDCHAWGSSPNIEFFRTILGIDSETPGFKTVKIEPHLGNLKNIQGEIPHPNGKISARYEMNNGKWTIHIVLPSQTSGHFIWQGRRFNLKEGANDFVL